MKALLKFLFACAVLTCSSYSAQISADQLNQFKNMPRAQQQALAKTMGVDLEAMEKEYLQKNKTTKETVNTPVYPRSTTSDAHSQSVNNRAAVSSEQPASKNQLKAFGYGVFANAPQTFAPTMDIAIPTGYIMGPGDEISIQIFGKENNEMVLPVAREGHVVIPQLGPFSVAGLSFVDMKKLLTSRIKEKIIGVDVVIGMASLRSMRVFVLGDAYKPGPYTLSSLSSITHALFAAGGISDIGSLRNIQLKRAGKLVKRLDLYDLLIHGDSSNDILLQSGDVIFVNPVGSRVTVSGQVRRPAIYELAEGDDFNQVLSMAGGLLPTAFASASVVERYNPNHLRSVMTLDLTQSDDLVKLAQSGDVIKIMHTADNFKESVQLMGAVTRAGNYQWQQGLRITDLIPSIDSHLLRAADLNYALVVREIDQAHNIEVLQFDIIKAINSPESVDNIVLQSDDKIMVFSNQLDNFNEKEKEQTKLANQSVGEIIKEEKEDDLQEDSVSITKLDDYSRQKLLLPIIQQLKHQGRTGKPIQLVEVDGAVKFPGVYPLSQNARINELLAASGGLDESAYLLRADVSRDMILKDQANKLSLSIDLAAAIDGKTSENIVLQSKDRLNIHRIPAWSENHVVELKGEFVFPGKYTIRRGESLSDLIKKAGGFTKFAYIDGSVFTRKKLQKLEQENLFKLADDLRVEMASKSLTDPKFSQSYADVQELLSDLTELVPVGRLVIDLPKLLQDSAYDVLLEDGDILYVPTVNNAVNVIGQVQVTTSHIYDADLSVDDYLTQSGGSKKRADEDRIYIISANGSIKMMADSNHWFANSASVIKPGDTIVVPLDAEYMNNLTLWSSATGILYNTAIAIKAITGF